MSLLNKRRANLMTDHLILQHWMKFMPFAQMNNSQSPSPPAPTSDPDAPLNLTKPKSESFSSSSSTNSTPRWNDSLLSTNNSADAASKLLPPALMMPRPYLPYPNNLHHHSSGKKKSRVEN